MSCFWVGTELSRCKKGSSRNLYLPRSWGGGLSHEPKGPVYTVTTLGRSKIKTGQVKQVHILSLVKKNK